jgi:16S rRNA (guanine(1405)-N(7))-methyltransferase
MEDPLDSLLAEIRATPKYAHVSDALIRRIGARELAVRRKFKEAVQETRGKLHQVGGLYQPGRMRYGEWLERIASESPPDAALREAMAHHASTRERLPMLASFYAHVFDGLPPVHRVLDVACGLNPLAARWMPLAPDATYVAVDVYADMMQFLDAALSMLGVRARCEVRDVIADCPSDPVDVALVLKTLPCLEQVDKDAGHRLLDTIRARCLIVSYPTRSVGGRNVGMARQYSERFDALVAGRGWRIERIEFENELVFRAFPE